MKRIFATFGVLILLLSCKQKDNNLEYKVGSYVEFAIPTSGLITDSSFNSKVIIYFPSDYNSSDTTIKYPIIYLLHPFGADYQFYKDYYDIGSILTYLNSKENLKKALLVMINGYNMFGGSFYVNSVDVVNNTNVFGKYEDYIIQNVLPIVENQYIPKTKLTGERYIVGYSMGAYGAMRIAHDRPDLFKGVASISGPLGFAVFSDPVAQAFIIQTLKNEINDSLIWVKYDSIYVKDSLVKSADTIKYHYYINSRFPSTFDTMALLLKVPDIYNRVYINSITLKNADTTHKTYIEVYRKSLSFRIKSFSNFIIALSAAFSPKYDLCSQFNQDSTYIISIEGTNCRGFYLPVMKNLSSVIQSVLLLWLMNNDMLYWYYVNSPQSNALVDNNLKVYLSTGKGYGQDLEYVIYTMDSVLYQYMKQKYQSKGKDISQYVTYKIVDGSTDPFGLPSTHNQYTYYELGEVLRFFLK